ncbi:hypothetical protein SCHPADRAFT_52072 [Schizopora paradoxa]|uniref:VWFA domain-containing protein n=1 Tax=Schizopora paradoxa TaxID=27342 RepID=A0A0H2S5U7_9AGAM|nr:hypothetical protein SCHPADRAFT_52072 [Schizopora paradoxa]
MSYRGDPVLENPRSPPRPAWTKGGTMMVFRKLEQFVPEFDAYLAKNGPRWREFAPPGCPVLTDKEGADLWGARLIGRWKSGAPLQLAPYKDDIKMAEDPDRNNDFDYHITDHPSINPRELTDLFCPFTAHTRKTAPRSLDPYIQQRYLEGGMIVRGGIPYGIEVTKGERDSGVSSDEPSKKRGLLFVSYQSSLDEGFVRQTVAYGGNDYFPTTSILPTNHGQDPIIGGPPPPARTTPAQNEVEYVNGPVERPPERLLLNLDDGKKLGIPAVTPVVPVPIIDPPGILVQYVPNPKVQPTSGEYLNLVLPPRPNTFDRIEVSGVTSQPVPAVDVKFVPNPRVPLQNGDQVNLVIDTPEEEVIVSGVAKVRSKGAVLPPGEPQEFFVTSRGGEWFFVPPISTLKKWSKSLDVACLDIMFIVDCTSNMQKYLDQLRDSVETIMTELVNSGRFAQQDIRIGIVAFRDHPQTVQGSMQSFGFVTKLFSFESEVATIKANVASLASSGGGDGPEAQCDGLADALSADWKDEATKVAILLTDSSPHGIGEVSDAFANGCPDKKDPVSIADLMAKKGITLHTLACEIMLSTNYSRATDFYNGVTKKTCGYMDALIDVTMLKNLVVGRVLESVDIRSQVNEQRSFIQSQLQSGSGVSTVSQSLYSKLRAANTQLYQMAVESIYIQNQNADDNANAWFKASKIDSTVTGSLKKVGFRIKSEYRSGGKTQSIELTKGDVTLTLCEQIVRACQSTT